MAVYAFCSLYNLSAETQAIDQGSRIAERECANCHGVEGRSADPKIPSIGGFSETAILELIDSYRAGNRPASTVVLNDGSESDMLTAIESITAEELQLIARYYASLSWEPIDQSYDEQLAKRGERVHKVKCNKCHLKGGSIPESDLAILSGQWKEYIESQFTDFSDRKRRMAAKMATKFNSLSEKDKIALIEYYASGGKSRE